MDEILNLIESVPEGFPTYSSVLKDYQDYSNDDFELTLTLLRQAQISENART